MHENKPDRASLVEPRAALATDMATGFSTRLHHRTIARMLRRAARAAFSGDTARALAIVAGLTSGLQ